MNGSVSNFRSSLRFPTAVSLCALLVAGNAVLNSVQGQARRVNQGNSVPLPANCTLRVNNPNGHIRITVAPRTDMEMLAGRHEAAGPAVSPDEIALEENGNQVTISTRGQNADAGVDLKLTVPEGTNLRLFSELGDIEVKGAAAGILAATRRGNVRVVVAETTGADVVLYSSGGTVHSDLPVKPHGAQDDRSLQGTLGKGGMMVMARSERGTVTLSSSGSDKAFAGTAVQPASTDRTIDVRTRPRDDRADDELLARGKDRPEPLKPDAGSSRSNTSSSKDDDDDVLKIESRLVTLNAGVSKRTGEALTALKKEDFSVFEDGIQQEIIHFQPVTMPFNLVLLIDLSGSVRDKINLIKKSAWRFVQATRPEDKVAIVTFTADAQVVSQLTNDRELLRRRIDGIRKPDGGTNFYDALAATIDTILKPVRGERNAVVIMSDGVDNALPGSPGDGSEITFGELMEHVQESDTIMFPIYLDTEEDAVSDYGLRAARGYAMAQRQLAELADATGGKVFRAERIEDLDGRYEEVASELRSIYSLGYYPTNGTKDGGFRKIRVKINREDVAIRARRGYYAPKE